VTGSGYEKGMVWTEGRIGYKGHARSFGDLTGFPWMLFDEFMIEVMCWTHEIRVFQCNGMKWYTCSTQVNTEMLAVHEVIAMQV
jgi:hypothetical protein